jgi:hypothetical protein
VDLLAHTLLPLGVIVGATWGLLTGKLTSTEWITATAAAAGVGAAITRSASKG